MFCYVGGGWYWPGQTIADLQDEMRRHLDAGYTMVKMKVGGLPLADDLRRVEAVLKVIGGGAQLAVDANGKFGREDALAYAKALTPFGLRWFEEPCDPLDFALLCRNRDAYAPPLATGENLYSTQDVENLARFGGLRAGSRRDPGRPAAGLRHRAVCATLDDARAARLAARFAVSARRQPDVARHRRPASVWAARNPIPACSARFGGFADDARLENGYLALSDRPGHRLRRAGAALPHHARSHRLNAAIPIPRTIRPSCWKINVIRALGSAASEPRWTAGGARLMNKMLRARAASSRLLPA